MLSLQRPKKRLYRPQPETEANHGHQQAQQPGREATRPLWLRRHLLHQGLHVNPHEKREGALDSPVPPTSTRGSARIRGR